LKQYLQRGSLNLPRVRFVGALVDPRGPGYGKDLKDEESGIGDLPGNLAESLSTRAFFGES
jgi:hypothetical protein